MYKGKIFSRVIAINLKHILWVILALEAAFLWFRRFFRHPYITYNAHNAHMVIKVAKDVIVDHRCLNKRLDLRNEASEADFDLKIILKSKN